MSKFPVEGAATHHTGNYLLRHVESFFVWKTCRDTPELQQQLLLRACRERGLEDHFNEVLREAASTVEARRIQLAEDLRFRYTLALEAYRFDLQIGRSTAAHQQPLSYWHDAAFVAEKLKNACGLLSRQRVMHTQLDLGLLPAIVDYVHSRPALLEHPAIAVYFHGYLALSEPDNDAHYFALKSMLQGDAAQFPFADLSDLYMLAINFCIHRINLRQDAFLKEVFFLYQSGLESGVLLEKGQISRFTYTNIALTALRLREFDWAYAFLHQWREHLPLAQRQGAYSFNLARYFCERGDYHQAMPLLLAMDFDDVLHNLIARAMLAKMYWEMNELAALESQLASFSTYLRRKRQLSEQQRLAYQHFVRFLRKLYAIPAADKTALALLRKNIGETNILAEKDWLLRMTEQVPGRIA